MGLASRICIRVDDSELKKIDANAKSLGLTRSAFVRFITTAPLRFDVVDGQPSASGELIIFDDKTMRDLYREHNRQGVNLNQMAHVANAFNRKSWLKPGQADELLANHAKAIEDCTCANKQLIERIDAIRERMFIGLGRRR